jgi:hypothetical protein
MIYTNINNYLQSGGKGVMPVLYYASLFIYIGLTIGLIVSTLNLDKEYQKHRNNPDKYDKPDHQTFEIPVIVFAILLCICWAGITFVYNK